MAKAIESGRQNELRTTESGTDDVEKSLELLDKVLSEFEEEQEISPEAEPESPSQGHQSEDDGYMSMNGRRAKFVPDFQPTIEAAALPTLPVPPDGNYSPPTPEEAERIISHLLPRISPSTTEENLATIETITTNTPTTNQMPSIDWKFSNNNHIFTSNLSFAMKMPNGDSQASSAMSSLISTNAPLQTTLPKARPTNVLPSRYASLPSTSPPRHHLETTNGIFIGIGISAVHDAVLKGGARMPETIVNEHPVTIYPGPPQKRVPPRTLPGSIERHREVCRKNPPSELSSPSSQELKSPIEASSNGFMLQNEDFIKRPKSPSNLSTSPINTATSFGIKISIATMDNIMNTRNKHHNAKIEHKMNKRNSHLSDDADVRIDSDDDRFSEDSLEDTSLPPPPPPPIVPPPPSLSAPVTPSKRHSIAWEVNLDDLCTNGNGFSSTKMIGRRRGRSGSETQSQSSICSTPGQSSASNKVSSDWPEPPDIPICSTEDEAASIYSDSDDVVPHPGDDICDGRATYVIRKGRKQRQRIDELASNSMSSINSKLSNEGGGECNGSNLTLGLPSPIYPPSMMLPNSRHSIALGATRLSPEHIPHHHHPQQSALNTPRSRLSLDLSSPNTTVELLKLTTTPTTSMKLMSSSITKLNHIHNSNHVHASNISLQSILGSTPTTPTTTSAAGGVLNTNHNPVFSPRYTEFKTYSSTFDGLQALENQSINSNSINNSNSNLNRGAPVAPAIVQDAIPLMRVASLPAITPPQLAGGEIISTPRRELAPPIEEDEEMDSEGHRGAPLRQIENNISALLRGEIAVVRVVDAGLNRPGRPIGFRPGVHKSESAKEMLLSGNFIQQSGFGPLPASPASSSPEMDSDEFPPLPPSPSPEEPVIVHGIQTIAIATRGRIKSDHGYRKDYPAPAVPPHRGPSINTLKTRSMDAGFSKSYRNGQLLIGSPHSPGTLPPDLPSTSGRRRLTSGFPRRSAQSPREERRLQTSCSLPETPIFARGCDIPRTPHRRAPEPPLSTGSRTNPRQNSLNSSSIVGIGCTTIGSSRQHRSINQALQANGEMLRLSGLPARGWYPKQRNTRSAASTEHLDRLHQGSIQRAWDTGTAARKPTTLPPNITPPKFFNKSPRDALRRVTSLLIRGKGNTTPKEKDSSKREKLKEREKDMFSSATSVQRSPGSAGEIELQHHNQQQPLPAQQKKKGFFKSFFKKTRHYSLENQ